jgi:HEAT repeat protein
MAFVGQRRHRLRDRVSEQLRHAVAEAMAALPDEGHPTLYDAISHEDMMVRRAAAFGLRRIRAAWAMGELYRVFLQDDQWYVRSAAQQAFLDLQNDQQRGPVHYPAVSEIPWLVNWAASRGESIPPGEASIQVLLEAMREGDTDMRALATRILGQVGEITATKALYGALRDRQEKVRTAAHLALADLEAQIGQPLPTPV